MDQSPKGQILREWPRWGEGDTFTMRDGQLRHKCGVSGKVVLLMKLTPDLYAVSCTACQAEGVLQLPHEPG